MNGTNSRRFTDKEVNRQIEMERYRDTRHQLDVGRNGCLKEMTTMMKKKKKK